MAKYLIINLGRVSLIVRVILYQTQKVRLAVSNLFSLQYVVLTLVFLATLIFVNGITYLIGYHANELSVK